jgi:hypothetical protein
MGTANRFNSACILFWKQFVLFNFFEKSSQENVMAIWSINNKWQHQHEELIYNEQQENIFAWWIFNHELVPYIPSYVYTKDFCSLHKNDRKLFLHMNGCKSKEFQFHNTALDVIVIFHAFFSSELLCLWYSLHFAAHNLF